MVVDKNSKSAKIKVYLKVSELLFVQKNATVLEADNELLLATTVLL